MRVALALLLFAAAQASAQTFPAKGIRIIAPQPPGGFNDTVARTFANGFSAGFAPGSVAENKPGAGTSIGSDFIAKSPPDGYNLLVVSLPFAVLRALYPQTKLDTLRDFTPIVFVGSTPGLLVVSAASPYKTVSDLLGAARAQPGAIFYASTGNGSSAHLFMELLKSRTGVNMQHVPYKGNGPAMQDVLGGRIGIMFANVPNALPQLTSGKLRALATSASKPLAAFPDVPPIAQAGGASLANFEANTWFGIVGPPGLKADVVARLNAEMNRILALPEVREQFAAQSVDIGGGSPDAFAQFLRKEIPLWEKVVRDAGMKAD